jgi:cyclophilin family peptidyl-prolyl cis-trans isomerase
MEVKLEESRKMNLLQAKIKAVEPELNQLGAEGKQDELLARYNAIKDEVLAEVVKLPSLKFTEEQRKAYTTIGGYPPLDNLYTIFGEVVEGKGVVDAIAKEPTDRYDRPQKDIKFTITIL